MGDFELNEYGELDDPSFSIEDDDSGQSSLTCSVCYNDISGTYYHCSRCGDDEVYCSRSCLRSHRRSEHYYIDYCAECASELPSRYTYNNLINDAFGEERRFCSSKCCTRYRRDNLCEECDELLPETRRYADDINSAMGHSILFCSSYCLQEYRRKQLCAECSRGLSNTYYHNPDMDSELGEEYRFCSQSCLSQFRREHICAECGDELPSRYTYCKRCGSSRYRFCSHYCFERHHENHHTASEDDGCIIVTACHGPESLFVQISREYRDRLLLKTDRGVKALAGYYLIAPRITKAMRQSRLFYLFTQKFLVKPLLLFAHNKNINSGLCPLYDKLISTGFLSLLWTIGLFCGNHSQVYTRAKQKKRCAKIFYRDNLRNS